MECKKCGATLADGAIYCNTCGARLDGKKLCENCQNWNEESSVFCGFCGTRIDGKKSCSICGAIVEGTFCPQCGNKIDGEKSGSKPNALSSKGGVKAKEATLSKVFNHIGSGSLIIGVLFALIFVFFIGIQLAIYAEGGETEAFKKSHNLFYFFGDYYKDIKKLRNDISIEETTLWFKSLITAQVKLYGVMGTIISALTLLSVVSFGLIAIIKYLVELVKKTEQGIDSWALACILSFLGGAGLLFLHTRVSVMMAYDGDWFEPQLFGSTKFNVSTIIGIIFCSVMLTVGVLFRVINKRQTLWKEKNILATICSIAGIALGIVVFILAMHFVIGFEMTYDYGELGVRLQGGPLLFNDALDIVLSGLVNKEFYKYQQITRQLEIMNIFNVFAQSFIILLIVFVVLSIKANVCGVTEKKNLSLLWAILSAVFAILALVFTILAFYNFGSVIGLLAEGYEESVNIEVSGLFAVPITAVIFSVLLLASAIVSKVGKGQANQE